MGVARKLGKKYSELAITAIILFLCNVVYHNLFIISLFKINCLSSSTGFKASQIQLMLMPKLNLFAKKIRNFRPVHWCQLDLTICHFSTFEIVVLVISQLSGRTGISTMM